MCVAAGGGGAGGSGDDSGTGTPGNPGGIYPAHASSIYAVSCGAWGSFLNTYGVWGGGQDYTVSLDFPVTGSYTFNFSADNYGSISLDGTAIITRSGEFNYTSTFTATATVSAGTHTVRVLGYNISGPAGVGAQIVKPDTSELWNTRTLLLTSGLTNSSTGGSSANGACSGGGGGGGYLGGEAGLSYGDDSGDAGAGNGGLNYGTTTLAGNGAIGAGKDVVYYPRSTQAPTSGVSTVIWTENVITYDSMGLSQVTGSYHTSRGQTLTLPVGTLPPGSRLLSDGTAQVGTPTMNGTLQPVTTTYSIWTPTSVGGGSSTVSRLGDAGYGGYIYVILTKKPGLKIKNPDSSGDWVDVENSYVRLNPPRPGGQTDTKLFSTPTTTNFKVPNEVSSLSINYLTAAGFKTYALPVIPGSIIPITVGDIGQPSSVGDFTISAYSRQVFRYVGNVDHLLNADVQVASATGQGLTTAGYNAQNTADAASVGLTYDVTYEVWHGDLYSTLYFNPIPTGELLTNFQIVPSGGGRAGGPSVTAQPTVANGYKMSIQFYDPYGGEGGYDGIFALQQSGYFTVSYSYPAVISGWKEIQNIYVKHNNLWKPVSQSNNISLL